MLPSAQELLVQRVCIASLRSLFGIFSRQTIRACGFKCRRQSSCVVAIDNLYLLRRFLWVHYVGHSLIDPDFGPRTFGPTLCVSGTLLHISFKAGGCGASASNLWACPAGPSWSLALIWPHRRRNGCRSSPYLLVQMSQPVMWELLTDCTAGPLTWRRMQPAHPPRQQSTV